MYLETLLSIAYMVSNLEFCNITLSSEHLSKNRAEHRTAMVASDYTKLSFRVWTLCYLSVYHGARIVPWC